MRTAATVLLAIGMMVAGIGHFTMRDEFVRIVPPALPWPAFIVGFTGVLEILSGIGLLVPRTRRLTAWCLVAFYIAVFPANIYAALNGIEAFGGSARSQWFRLPFQLVFIAWAVWIARGSGSSASARKN